MGFVVTKELPRGLLLSLAHRPDHRVEYGIPGMGQPHWPGELRPVDPCFQWDPFPDTLCGESRAGFGAGQSWVLTRVLPCGLESVAGFPQGGGIQSSPPVTLESHQRVLLLPKRAI